MERIVIDTERLTAGASALETCQQSLKRDVAGLYDLAAEIASMWSGPAHDAFDAQFAADRAALTELCAEYAQCVEGMREAAREYDRCAEAVGSLVAGVQI